MGVEGGEAGSDVFGSGCVAGLLENFPADGLGQSVEMAFGGQTAFAVGGRVAHQNMPAQDGQFPGQGADGDVPGFSGDSLPNTEDFSRERGHVRYRWKP